MLLWLLRMDRRYMDKFRLSKSINVVSLDAEGKGKMVTLPSGSDITVCGASSIPSCVEISCEGARYNAFEQDLRERSGKTSATTSS